MRWVLFALGGACIVTLVVLRLQSGAPMAKADLILGGAAIAIGAGACFAFRWKHRPQTLRPFADVCQRCGYDLVNAPIPRCPECGAIRSFKASAEELGLDPHELKWRAKPRSDGAGNRLPFDAADLDSSRDT